MKEKVMKYNNLVEKLQLNLNAKEEGKKKVPYPKLKDEWIEFIKTNNFNSANENIEIGLKEIESEINIMQDMIDLGRENNQYSTNQLLRLKNLYPHIKNGGQIGYRINDMFILHNEMLPQHTQNNKTCGYCVKKVWERVIALYKQNFE